MPLLIQDGNTKQITGPGGMPLEQVDGSGTVLFYLQDQLGSIRGLADTSGTIVASYSFDVYGNLLSKTGSASTPLQYAGQYTDSESGLQYLRARYYDPSTMQFLTVDPLLSQTGDPYSYTSGDALNGMDPTGLDCSPFSPQDCVSPVGHVLGQVGNTAESAGRRIAIGVLTYGIATIGSTHADLTSDDPLRVARGVFTVYTFVGAPELRPDVVGGRLAIDAAEDAARWPVGRAGCPLAVSPGTNAGEEINGILYSGHA